MAICQCCLSLFTSGNGELGLSFLVVIAAGTGDSRKVYQYKKATLFVNTVCGCLLLFCPWRAVLE